MYFRHSADSVTPNKIQSADKDNGEENSENCPPVSPVASPNDPLQESTSGQNSSGEMLNRF